MLISTKGRYAIRVLVDMAEHSVESNVPLKDIAQRQQISKKYLESIMVILSKAGLVDSCHGKGGGYKLNRLPEQYSLLEILNLTEETLAPVKCLQKNCQPCERRANCRTVGMWSELNTMITDFFKNKSIADLMGKDTTDDYII